MRALVFAVLCLGVAGSIGAQRPAARRCLLQVDSIGREGLRDETLQGNVNYYGGGGVFMHCIDQSIFLHGDSLEAVGGNYVHLMTATQYRDDDVTIDADDMAYTRNDERLQARGNVRIVNHTNGSTLEGPAVDYLRAVKGIRDSSQTTATGRPTVHYQVLRQPGDTVDPAPYVITADLLRARGTSQLRGWGNVEVDRDSLAGRGDSLRYVQGETDLAILMGAPATLRRRGADSFYVAGREVQLGLDGDALRDVRAYGAGHVIGGAGEIIADSTALAFTDGDLVQTLAWDRDARARVRAEGYDVRGDSVAIDTPGERLRELRVFVRGLLQEPTDSTVPAPDSTVTDTAAGTPIQNTMTGDHLVARFTDWDSAGTVRTRLVDIVATGRATSLFSRQVERNGEPSPTINYTRADTIIVVMKQGDSTGVQEVRAFGNVDGVQLEKASLERRVASERDIRREDGP